MLEHLRIRRKARPAGRLLAVIEDELAETQPSEFELDFAKAQMEICVQDAEDWREPVLPYDDAWDCEMAFMFHVDYTNSVS